MRLIRFVLVALFTVRLISPLILMMVIYPVVARDLGQWENSSPEIREWYRSLMRPDEPHTTSPCCGEADAYWADEVHVDKEGRTVATITDDRDDRPLGRPHVPVGTQIIVPNIKLKYDQGNPTGHAIIFLSTGGDVYCYVQGGGT